jgi:hypothetical protein
VRAGGAPPVSSTFSCHTEPHGPPQGHEDSFEQSKGSVSLELVLTTAEEVLNASVPASLRDETLARLAGSQLSESRQQLIFNYKLAFERQT